MTLQALSESNRRLWLEAMDGKEPVRRSAALSSKGFMLCLSTENNAQAETFVTSALSWPLESRYFFHKHDLATHQS